MAKNETPDSPVHISDVDRLSWLNIGFIKVARTFVHGDTDVIFIEVETLSARAAIHRQEVRSAGLLMGAQRFASQMTSMMVV